MSLSNPFSLTNATRGGWCLLLLLVFIASPAHAGPIDQLKREAGTMERARDCEGAYKKYEEMKQLAQKISSKRRRISLIAFISTKLNKLKSCYEKCNPTPEQLELLNRANQYKEKGQKRRAYRIYLRLLRGKNPRCTTWKEAHKSRKELAAAMPRGRRRSKQVDPCAMEDETKTELKTLVQRIKVLDQGMSEATTKFQMPNPPNPPRWARTKRQKDRWRKRWQRRMKWRHRRKRSKHQVKRLQKAIALFRTINEIREKVFNWREEFQDCDQLYTELKTQSTKLRQAQQSANNVVVGLYKQRIKRVRAGMRWFARKYRQQQKEKKTDNSTVESLKRTLEQQRDMLDKVTKDMVALSSLLIFKGPTQKEGSLLGNSASAIQNLTRDQNKLFAALQKSYPQYLQSAQGRKSLRNHLATLERFEKALERFQQQGQNNDKIDQTLASVRASIAALEKADETLTNKPVTTTPAAMQVSARQNGNTGTNRSSWGWLLLLSGLGLGAAAIFFIMRERKKSQNFESF
ncbi:MAG TPA: hypothetical protein DCE42_26970 [Myxococcales bacterium]|nr:hypothetical protein [Deltaproteobacteria bacterium]HAA58435.1 hypothetical protein [Myxococcales bacterium]|tara:strand:- start:4768 stop:6321 length:1554 start_codon:yes stop_codon:yes gene_type:complete